MKRAVQLSALAAMPLAILFCASLFAATKRDAPGLAVQIRLTESESDALARDHAPNVATFITSPRVRRRIASEEARGAAALGDHDAAKKFSAYAAGGPHVTIVAGAPRMAVHGGPAHIIPWDVDGEYAEVYEELRKLPPVPDDYPRADPGTPLHAWVESWFGPGGGAGR